MIARTWSGGSAAAVGPLGGQRLADVGDREDARVAVELLAGQAEVVAAAVEPLVVGAGGRGEVAEGADALEDPHGQRRVAAHLHPLLVVELARLVEDQVGDAELADVVQQRGAAQVAQLVAGCSRARRRRATAMRATPTEWRPV